MKDLPFICRSEESKNTYLQILKNALEGKTAKQIAEAVDIPKRTVAQRLNKLMHAGMLPYARIRKFNANPSARVVIADLRKIHRTQAGTLSQIIDALSVEQAQWLFEQTPKGSTLAESIAAIVIDAYNDEKDKG